ncbi:MAG: large conductance mechanosensitive channel protein MscL [Erysipelotrichaceae bacterium]|nr:large conductance mechanosensitive channel protein MscL [Erysipelotrichaceae bacterium]
MKKFLEEFKEFALKGNVMDMAVGVLIGGAFSSIVTSLTDNILNPIIACFGGTEAGLVTPLGDTGQVIDWGAFISSIINFLILALVLFVILKAVNKLTSLKKQEEEAPAEEEEPEPSEEVKLLTTVVEELKKLNKK